MKCLGLFVAGLLMLVVLTGCQSTARPNWTNPGPASVQQKRALRYDPYPEPDPLMAGARPREYENPPSEASRSRWHLGGWGQ